MKQVFNELSMADIKKTAPSVFQTKQKANLSEHYVHIPTDKVINDMIQLGWKPCQAVEIKARKKSTIGYQRHMIKFFNPNIEIEGTNGDNVYPQILLTNSHDGKNAFTFTAGLFRMICENGLVVSTQEFENMKIRHYGYDFETLQNTIKEMVEKLPLTVESMNKFKSTKLSQKQAEEFATKALAVRFPEDELSNISVDINGLLVPTRNEDKGDDLWSIFNVVQEKLVHGMFNYSYAGKNRKAPKIKNFRQDMALNEKLYDLALEYAN